MLSLAQLPLALLPYSTVPWMIPDVKAIRDSLNWSKLPVLSADLFPETIHARNKVFIITFFYVMFCFVAIICQRTIFTLTFLISDINCLDLWHKNSFWCQKDCILENPFLRLVFACLILWSVSFFHNPSHKSDVKDFQDIGFVSKLWYL